ncbi:hypothetical protein CYLTODRAFT_495138 [Cylindrobasidium torrendii FP15055 ss-10]|uniref:C2H2-type domain-containing protein n=1 Tax=Cylindrobasidium torrendii FP15055 ss-10 TaxID=1314674 RepID=A0A0D7AWI8_9AGAR|nr:hypothetical protein CYLTODRAFT_495138 [Cylindrobasidium torrendii FP15055 ss-10]
MPSIHFCPRPGCHKPFGTRESMLRHVSHVRQCEQWLEHSAAAFDNLRLSESAIPNTVRDEASRLWDDDEEEEEGPPDDKEEGGPLPEPRLSPTRTTIEEVEDEGDDPYGGSIPSPMPPPAVEEDEDDEDDDNYVPRQMTHEELRELLEMQGLAGDLFEVIDDAPAPSALRSRLMDKIGTQPRYLDDNASGNDSSLFYEHHPTGGKLISVAKNIHQTWNKLFGHPETTTPGSTEVPSTEGHNFYHPFASKLDWEVAKWMVSEGIAHSAFDRLLQIDGVKEKLGLSFKNTAGVHRTLEDVPRRAGKWHIKHLTFPDREDDPFILRHRDILEAVKALWGDPKFAGRIVYRPSKVFTDRGKKHRIVNEMWTAEWWWQVQDLLPEGHTLASLIISTDKTQLTQFSGSRQAYPVYLTLGNIPSALRRKPSEQACILVAYLPVEKIARGNLSKDEVSSRYQRLFHAAMAELFAPLVEAGKSGVEMASGDGILRIVHPILAAYVADYPEQCLVTCSKQRTCPKCFASRTDLDSPTPLAPRTHQTTLATMLAAKASSTTDKQYFTSCMEANVNGNVRKPFWEDLPHTNIHLAQTPDVLHQLYQGVLKHLIDWCQRLLTENELDNRIRRLPHGVGLRHFKHGISALSQISGSERKNMGKILLGCIVDKLHVKAVTAVRAILDFIYLAQYRTHDMTTLGYMTAALDRWHANKEYFIRTKCRKDFYLPKFHSLVHYVEMIRLLGTTDNFNTEMFERLHIEFAKKGWRASNHRDEFPQMTAWVTRQETVQAFTRYLDWVHCNLVKPKPADAAEQSPSTTNAVVIRPPTAIKKGFQDILLPKNPTLPRRYISVAAYEHQIPKLATHLVDFINRLGLEHARLNNTSPLHYTSTPFDRIDVYHSFKLSREHLNDDGEERDWVKATPLHGGRFDTVVVLDGEDAEITGLDGTRIGRVKLIFRLPKTYRLRSIERPFPSFWPESPLCYIHWYTKPKLIGKAEHTHNLPSVSKQFNLDGDPVYSIIPLSNVRQSCMLFPDFGRTARQVWDTDELFT